ncbi:MAG TPA: hypothetical protein VLV86_12575 [Vicinamibacterales bacterium]|nr:hypothetical protein [Vicinamibacterales bacterium]
MTIAQATLPAAVRRRPPAWLVIATAALALTILVLAVAETDLRAHYLIDQGEFISVIGLIFITGAGFVLFARRQLLVSLPLVFPWLLYPIVTQGDQIIDNLSINPMRIVVHVLLAAIFVTPVAVIVIAARRLLESKDGRERRRAPLWTALFPGLRAIADGRRRQGTLLLASALMVLEIWLADQYLGTLMIVTLMLMIVPALLVATFPEEHDDAGRARRPRSEAFALAVLLVGVAISTGAYFGYKNRPGAYQGSPSFFMDPKEQSSNYRLDRVAVPSRAPELPASADLTRQALTAYGHTLERMLAGYHILDRNYTYDFHNELFLRHTPLVPNYRQAGLRLVDEGRTLRADADMKAAAARANLRDDDPLAALLDDVRGYVAFNFDRAPILERLSGEFEKTPAGLQHAAHLYEGESKFLGTRLAEIVQKHHAVTESPVVASVTSEFVSTTQALHDAYAHHIVGF